MRTQILLLIAFPLAAQDALLRVSEPIGVAREHEPVAVTIEGKERIVFVTVGARQTRLMPVESARPVDTLRVDETNRVGCIVENAVFRADLSGRLVGDRQEDSGTLRALTYKPAGVTLLRTQNRMHWAPSIQRSGAKGYASIGTWHPVQQFHRALSPGFFVHTRDGFHQDYPEVRLQAEYRFFAHAPYFLFHSVMQVERPLVLYLLRNQEMTMDDRFTHVAWPGRNGATRLTTFDERKALLEKEPLPAETPWVCFVNLDRGYGFGAVVLDYQATKTANPFTSINDGANNGKYWDRRLITMVDTPVAAGDRWTERTAYVLFRATRAQPIQEFLDWEKRLRNPVRVEVVRRPARTEAPKAQ